MKYNEFGRLDGPQINHIKDLPLVFRNDVLSYKLFFSKEKLHIF